MMKQVYQVNECVDWEFFWKFTNLNLSLLQYFSLIYKYNAVDYCLVLVLLISVSDSWGKDIAVVTWEVALAEGLPGEW